MLNNQNNINSIRYYGKLLRNVVESKSTMFASRCEAEILIQGILMYTNFLFQAIKQKLTLGLVPKG